MAIITTDSQHYTNIANTIRDATNSECEFYPAEMAEKIQEVYEAGKDLMWDIIQNYGAKEALPGVFQKPTWTDENFKPKYTVYPVASTFTNGVDNAETITCQITDLRKDAVGVDIDWSFCSNFNNAFLGVPVKYVDTIDASNAQYVATLFYRAKALEEVGKLILPTKAIEFGNTSLSASNLKKIHFEGVFQKNVTMKNNSKLELESAKSAIMHLKNYAGTDSEFAYTISFHANVWDLLNADGNTAPDGNTWSGYVTTLGWNI